MASGTGGYGITKADMEASRLVFVMVQNAKPRRKVAIPIMEGMSWSVFQQQVAAKLKIRGIAQMTLVATGEPVRSLASLQDIDEIYVQEATAQTMPSQNSPSTQASFRQHPKPDQSPLRTSQTDMPSTTSTSNGSYQHGHQVDDKYAKKGGLFVNTTSFIKRTLPFLNIPPTLPVTVKDTEPGRRKKRKMSSDMRFLLLGLCLIVIMMLLSSLYMRSKGIVPAADLIMGHDPVVSTNGATGGSAPRLDVNAIG